MELEETKGEIHAAQIINTKTGLLAAQNEVIKSLCNTDAEVRYQNKHLGYHDMRTEAIFKSEQQF
jgi:hypothetical protein